MKPKKKTTDTLINADSSISELYKSLIDHSNSAIFISKPTGEIIEVNNAAEKMFGYSKSEFIKLGQQGILDHSDPNLHVLLQQRKENGKMDGELIGINKKGEKFPVEFTSSILINENGEEYCSIIIQDITNRKIIEQQMLLMLNNIEEGFILLDINLLILNFNSQIKNFYKKYLHLNIEKGLSIFEFVKQNKVAEVKEIYDDALQGKIIYKTVETTDEDGTSHYFKFKYAALKNEAHKIIGIFITIKEITEETKSNIEIQKIRTNWNMQN